MDTNELMKPRNKVIADYPFSKDRIGDILELVIDRAEIWDNCRTGKRANINPKEFPAIFKPLAWYEERLLEEMPEYIKRTRFQGNSNKSIEVGDIVKVKWVNDYFDKVNYPTIKLIAFFTEAEDGTGDLNYDVNCFEPATEADYLNSLTDKKD